MFTSTTRPPIPWVLWFARGIAVGPRGRNDAVVRVVDTEHGNLAAKCTVWPNWWEHGLSSLIVHHQRKDKVRGRPRSKREKGVLGPVSHGGRQLTIRPGTLGVRSDLDRLVELPEELERDFCNFELTDQVPREKCIKDLFCDINRREVLNLGPYVSDMQLERDGG